MYTLFGGKLPCNTHREKKDEKESWWKQATLSCGIHLRGLLIGLFWSLILWILVAYGVWVLLEGIAEQPQNPYYYSQGGEAE